MNKMKKVLLLAMSLVMTTCVFAACSGDKTESSDNTPPTSSEAPATSSEAPEVSEVPEESLEPEVTKYQATIVLDPMDRMNGVTFLEVEAGDTIMYPTMNSTEGKIFAGWIVVDIETGEESPAPTFMPEGDITVYAKWTLVTKTVTVTKLDGSTKKYTIAVEDNYEDMENPILSIYPHPMFGGPATIQNALDMEISEDGSYYTVAYEGIPETWELKDYEIKEVMVKSDDNDVTSKIAYFDRLNKKLLQPDGSIKNNVANYWDGADNIVTVENQQAVVSGADSDFAVKVSFNPSLLTAEQCADADAAWGGWSTNATCRQSWVAYAIPVDSMNLNLTVVTFDMKVDNMNANVTVYAAKNAAEGAEYVYEIGKNVTLQKSAAQDLGDGWYRYTLTLEDNLKASQDADFFVFSLDNCQTGYDISKPSIAYIDNVVFAENTAHEHAYTMSSYDENSHFTACVCGKADPSTVVAHTMEKANDDNYHWEACSCGYTAGKEAHGDVVYETGETWHKLTCGICGAKTEAVAHEFAWVEEEKQDVKKCACGMENGTFIKVNDTATTIDFTTGEEVKVDFIQFIGMEIFSQQNIKNCISFTIGETTYAFDPMDTNIFIVEGRNVYLKGSCFEALAAGEHTVTFKFITKDNAEHTVKVKANIIKK